MKFNHRRHINMNSEAYPFKAVRILFQVIRSLLYMILNAGIHFLEQLEMLSPFIMAISPIVFQSLVFIRYPSFISFLMIILSGCAFLSFQFTNGHIKLYNTDKNVIDDIINMYPNCKFRKSSVTDLINIDDISDFPLSKDAYPSYFTYYIEAVTSKLRQFDVAGKRINLIYVEPSLSSTQVLAGGQIYRPDFHLPSFIFINSSNHPFNKFIVLHELGHTTLMSSLDLMVKDIIKESYLFLAIWMTFQLHWSLIVIIIFMIFLLHLIDYWKGIFLGVHDFSRLNSEIFADLFAARNLSQNDREQILSIVRKGYMPLDRKFSKAENSIRSSYLVESLKDPKIENILVAPFKPGNLLSRVLLINLLAFFVTSPTYVDLIYGIVIWVIIGFVNGLYVVKHSEIVGIINRLTNKQ